MRANRAALAAVTMFLGASLALTGCLTSTGSSSGGATVTGSGGSTAGSGQCGGKAVDLNSALRVLTDPVGCPGAVNTYWHDQLGSKWTAPRYIAYQDGQVPADACGAQAANDPDQFADNALYCSLDDTVAYSTNFMREMAQAGGPTFPLFVLMHELGHRANRIGNTVGVITLSEENQADCDAGLTTRFADKAHRLTLGNAFGGVRLFFSLGDTRGGWFQHEATSADDDAHGAPAQRAHAFVNGYTRSIGICRRTGQSTTGAVPLV